MKPAQILYHGTVSSNIANISNNGLVAVNYDKVYLTSDIVVAYEYCKQTQLNNNDYNVPVICVVDAIKMYDDGFEFEHALTRAVWTTNFVPVKYITQIVVQNEAELEHIVTYAQRKLMN